MQTDNILVTGCHLSIRSWIEARWIRRLGTTSLSTARLLRKQFYRWSCPNGTPNAAGQCAWAHARTGIPCVVKSIVLLSAGRPGARPRPTSGRSADSEVACTRLTGSGSWASDTGTVDRRKWPTALQVCADASSSAATHFHCRPSRRLIVLVCGGMVKAVASFFV